MLTSGLVAWSALQVAVFQAAWAVLCQVAVFMMITFAHLNVNMFTIRVFTHTLTIEGVGRLVLALSAQALPGDTHGARTEGCTDSCERWS